MSHRGRVVRGEASESDESDDDELDMDQVGARIVAMNTAAEGAGAGAGAGDASKPAATTATAASSTAASTLAATAAAATAAAAAAAAGTGGAADASREAEEDPLNQSSSAIPSTPGGAAGAPHAWNTPGGLSTSGRMGPGGPLSPMSPMSPGPRSADAYSPADGSAVGAAQKRLRERNASLKKGLATRLSHVHNGVIKEVASSISNLTKIQQTSQDVSHHLRVFNDDIRTLNEKMEIITSYDFLPKFSESVRF
ncbi:hypothetical protein CAOG_00648 [Capsaspora owczarzaki ATCC 30864]|uniref:Biogenesis of lysosome-related organelles complex 1 subunit 3 n=1 Tax=Capsaspora owczarzaki (strain ATCC 30864) TaxID=595528 RepID=A0A0D2U1R2_CAPO3|nr:hypothetical protein CAOG_00648 [Capsaspora owczarzaki ATCC 30864]KJE89101.1 hypothetical protein CAOG_000648 [Capsaspora owczarzaki ATCC 30864]|eukprot:XP_004365519.1 hypothetical protein CAOG_00648 [Capsaspora owczarzaki ATCC 30864]